MSATKTKKRRAAAPEPWPPCRVYSNGIRIPMRAFKKQKRREFAQLRAAFDTFFLGSGYIRGPQGYVHIDSIRRALDETQAQLRRWWKGA